MFKKLRIAVLLYVLLFVAVGQYLTMSGTTDWDRPLWVDVYWLDSGKDPATRTYLDTLDADSFAGIESFFAEESARFGVPIRQPFRIEFAGQLNAALPAMPASASPLTILWWSLKMRLFVTRLHWTDDRPTPDITLFMVYHDSGGSMSLDRSTALRKGMIAIANVFASREMSGTNTVIAAHELLHTLGATDKYDLTTNMPFHPAGFADPERQPRFPQSRAEIMGGRIPLAPDEAVIPAGLRRVIVGPQTALEIGWIEELPRIAAR